MVYRAVIHPGCQMTEGLGLGQFPDERPELVCRNSRLLLRPFRRVGIHEAFELSQVLDESLGVGYVVQALGQKLVDHGEVERVVRSRANHHEVVRLGGGDVGPDVDDSELAAVFQSVHEVVDLLDVDRLEDVPELQDHVLGVFQVIGDPFSTHAGERQGGMLHVSRAGGVMVAIVGSAQSAKKGAMHVPKRSAPVGESDGPGAVSFGDVFQLGRNVVQGFVPAHLAPLALAPVSDPHHGRLGPFVVLDERLSAAPLGHTAPFMAGEWGLPRMNLISPFSVSTSMGQRTVHMPQML